MTCQNEPKDNGEKLAIAQKLDAGSANKHLSTTTSFEFGYIKTIKT